MSFQLNCPNCGKRNLLSKANSKTVLLQKQNFLNGRIMFISEKTTWDVK